MSRDATTAMAEAVVPHVRLIEMGSAYWVSRTVHAAAALGLADLLAEGPKSAVELAAGTGLPAPPLHRLLRTLAGLGLMTADEAQSFSLTPLGKALKTDAPGMARSTILERHPSDVKRVAC